MDSKQWITFPISRPGEVMRLYTYEERDGVFGQVVITYHGSEKVSEEFTPGPYRAPPLSAT